MTTLPSDLPVVVNRTGGKPLAVQISAQLRAAITGGALHAGDRLPSSRDLAATLGVSRTVVTNAYARLFAEGWLEGRHGSGTYVADVQPAAMEPVDGHDTRTSSAPVVTAEHPALAAARRPGSMAPFAIGPPREDLGGYGGSSPREGSGCGAPDTMAPFAIGRPAHGSSPREIDLEPGVSWAAGIDEAAWRRAWRQAGAHLPSRMPDPYGLPELRAEIAAYLRRSRGLTVTPAHVLVTQGTSSGLALLAAAVLRPGDKAGIEEPGYPTGREVLRRAGAQVLPCRIDAHGILPEELPAGLRLLYTTPAHQYPLGGRLPVSRRQALTGWARESGALVVEDDYDSEFRYDVGSLPAMHSMDPDVIVYLGTASKVLATAFGAGWLVAPPALVDQLAALRPRLGVRIPEPVQWAVHALLASGDLERHVRKMRLEYARRRAALVDGLNGGLSGGSLAGKGQFRLLGDTAGIHVVLELPDGYPTVRLVEAAAARGIGVYTLDRYFAGKPAINGLILGYGTATLPQLRRAAAELARLLTRLP